MLSFLLGLVYLLAHAPDQCEATDRLAPHGWQGNFWGPSANQDRREGKDDSKLYCVEMTEKAFRAAGVALSEPIALGDMERASDFPLSMLGLHYASGWVLDRPISFQDRVYLPGNDHHGVWGSPFLLTIFPPTDVADRSVPDLQASREK